MTTPDAAPGPSRAPEEAARCFQEGYAAHMSGRLDDAKEWYARSIAVSPTAEAHTFLGWALSAQGRLDDAIAQCHLAISVDPEFGNPYNDIGAYLVEQGRLDEAVPWLERAKRASRYEPRHFPYFNLARIYIAQQKLLDAMTELRGALTVEPGYGPAKEQLVRVHRLLGLLN